MRLNSWRGTLAALVGVTLLSCVDSFTGPKPSPISARIDLSAAGTPKVVISQVYGGGGNSGAPYQNDYVELFNAGTASQDLTGWSIQYASAAGTFASGPTTPPTLLSGSIAPGQYYLVKQASQAAVGALLPNADATATIAMSATAGKVALVDQAAALSGCGSAATCTTAQLGHIIDLVGYGIGMSGATFFEGSGAAPTLSNTRAAIRADHGCTDTNNNGADFASLAPAPRNSSTSPAPCLVVVGPLHHIVVTGTMSVTVGSTITLTAALKDESNNTITDPAATLIWGSADEGTAHVVEPATGGTATIRGLQPGGPIEISVTATSNGVTTSTVADPHPAVTVLPATAIVPSTTLVSEIHYDNNGTDVSEAIEIEGDANASLAGWKLVLYNGNGGIPYDTTDLTGTIPATCDTRGVMVVHFPDTPTGTIQNGSPDGWALLNADGQVTEFKSYEGTFTATVGAAAGLTSTAIDADESAAPTPGRSVQRAGNGVWFGPRRNTFGVCNQPLPPPPQGINVTRGKTELALAMQTQFVGLDLSGIEVTSPVWSTSNPAVITVDQNGVVTAKGLGEADLIVTAGGATGTAEMTVYLAAGSTGIRLGHNTEFGEPTDANPSDDFLIRRPQYTVSYNPQRGGANWVSWNLDASHIGDNGRCPGTCYSADTAISNAGLPAYTTADWVSGATYDRGHMAPSADWTSSEADNNTTFFLSNFLPQHPDLNQGRWEKLEEALRDSVRSGREAYIIAGGIFTNGAGLGTLLNLGKIAIPDSTWKIAVITPAGTGLNADGTLPANTTVMAVNMPNVAQTRDTNWQMYLTTVRKIEKSTGYDFLALLADAVECRVEGNCAPSVSAFSGATIFRGETYTTTGSFSDPDADSWTALVNYGDGSGMSALPLSGNSFTLSHTYTSAGPFTVTVSVNDGTATATSSATVVVKTATQGIADLDAAVASLSPQLNKGQRNSLLAKLGVAAKQLEAGNSTPAVNVLEAFIEEIQATMQSGRISKPVGTPLVGYALRVIASIMTP